MNPATPVTRTFIAPHRPSRRRRGRVGAREEDLAHHPRGAERGDGVGDLGPVQRPRRPHGVGQLGGVAPAHEARHALLDQPAGVAAVGHHGGQAGGHGLHQHARKALVTGVGGHEEDPRPAARLRDLGRGQAAALRDPACDVRRQAGDQLLQRGTQGAGADDLERPRHVRLAGSERGEGPDRELGVLRHLEPADPDDRGRGRVRCRDGDGGVEPGGRGYGARVPPPHLLRVGRVEHDHALGPPRDGAVQALVQVAQEPPERVGRGPEQAALLGVDAVHEGAAEQQPRGEPDVHAVRLQGRGAGDPCPVAQQAGDEPGRVGHETAGTLGVDPRDRQEPHVAVPPPHDLPAAQRGVRVPSDTPTIPSVTSDGAWSRTPRRHVTMPPMVTPRRGSNCCTIRRSIRPTPGPPRRQGQVISSPSRTSLSAPTSDRRPIGGRRYRPVGSPGGRALVALLGGGMVETDLAPYPDRPHPDLRRAAPRTVLARYSTHYNGRRPHRALRLFPPRPIIPSRTLPSSRSDANRSSED